MFCTKCGAMIDGAGKFCPKCGAPIAGEEKKQQQTVNEMEQGKRISQTLRKKLIVGFIGAAAIIIIIIVVTARDTMRSGSSDLAAMYETTEIKGTIRPIEFDVVGINQQPDSLKDIIAEKYADPFQISYTPLGEELYIAIGYGEQPSGGYSISVNAFYETADTLVIDTTLIGPGKAEIVTSTPTRPYIVVKTENVADKMIEFK